MTGRAFFGTQVLPVEQPWIPLVEALGWARFRCARPLELLVSEASKQLRMPMAICLDELQAMWPELADRGTVKELAIRGVPGGSRRERALTIDELRQCRHLNWMPRDEGVAVERYGPSYAEQWDRLDDEVGEDFASVVIARDDLLRAYPAVSEAAHRRLLSGTTVKGALAWLEGQLRDELPRSVRKADLIDTMVHEFGITLTQARSNWSRAVKDYPAWAQPGRPRKKSVEKIEPENKS